MDELTNIDDICLISECSNKAFHHTRVMLTTFVTKNSWFDGTIIILTLESDQLSDHNKTILESLYHNVRIITIPDSEISKVIEKVNKRKQYADILDYLKIFAFKIKSKGNLYISRYITVCGDLSNILDDNSVSIVSTSESFPSTGDDLSGNLMFVSNKFISNDLYESLYTHLMQSKLDGSFSYLKDFLEYYNIRLNILPSIYMVDSKIFPNNKYSNFVRYSKSISSILVEKSTLSSQNHSKIQTYWNQQLHRSQQIIKSPEFNKKVKTALIKKKQEEKLPSSLREDSLSTFSTYDADFCVMITTYNRKKCIESLTARIRKLNSSCKIVVIDDCSDEEIDTSNIDTYIKLSENNGKENWWKTINLLWDKALGYNCKYYMMLPDDALPKDGMFEEAIRIWNSINDPFKIAMHLANNNRKRNWTNFYRTEFNEDVYKTQTTEFSFLCTRDFIRYIIPPINKNRWKKNRLLGSGVGEKLNRYWINHKKNIYGVKTSLITSNCLCPDSVMNAEERKINPWILK